MTKNSRRRNVYLTLENLQSDKLQYLAEHNKFSTLINELLSDYLKNEEGSTVSELDSIKKELAQLNESVSDLGVELKSLRKDIAELKVSPMDTQCSGFEITVRSVPNTRNSTLNVNQTADEGGETHGS